MNIFRLSALVLLAGFATAYAQLPSAPRGETFRAGEALTIEVPLDTAGIINGGYPIDSAGYADLPVVGRVQVDGRTQEELERFLAEKLANYLRDTHVKAAPAMRLTMLGHWTRQGQYYVSPNSTVWEASLMAGGIAGERTLTKIKVWRGSQITEIPFLDEYSRGRTLLAAGIRSGDIIVIPVPRDNTGFWYWFRESLSITAQIAGIVSTVITLYLTYELLDERTGTVQPSVP